MNIKNDKSTIFLTKDKELNKCPILFIHGFTGSTKSWKETRFALKYPSLAIDVPGHGKSIFNNLHKNYDYKDFRSELYLCLKKINIDKIHLCGYSMGGRLAIVFGAMYPDKINTLILRKILPNLIKNKVFEKSSLFGQFLSIDQSVIEEKQIIYI